MRRSALIVLVLLLSAPAAAQTPQPTPALLDRVYQCAAMTDGVERLGCYDSAVQRLRAAESEGELIALDRQQAQTVQRESFGFNLPNLTTFFRGGGDAAELERVEAEVERVVRLPGDRIRFVLNNGQSWTQTELRSAQNVRPGDSVTIRRAAMGTFMLVSERGGAGHRVRRDE